MRPSLTVSVLSVALASCVPLFAHAMGGKNVACTRQVLISSQSNQEFLGETLELMLVRESMKKGFSRTPVIRRFDLGLEAKTNELFTVEQLKDSELLMVKADGVYDGPCSITVRRARLVGSTLQGQQEMVGQYTGENCARGIVKTITPSLKKKFPGCGAEAAPR